MAEIIKMPLLSDTMTEGVIAAWHKKIGDPLKSGDLLAEIETDKATMDFESPVDGFLLHIGVEEGNGIPVGTLLAIIGEKGEDVSALIKSAASEQQSEEPAAPVQEVPAAEEKVVAVSSGVSTRVPETQVRTAPQVQEATPSIQNGDGRIKASPLAKAMAKDRGIDLRRVQGSGESGRIVKRDIETFKEEAASTPAFAQAPAGAESHQTVRVSQMRKTIAKRLSQSKFTAPHFYLTMEISMDKAVEARQSLNAFSPVKISYNDMIIKAAAAALRRHPKVNASWMDDAIFYYDHIHIGMAVAVDEGLIVPVIRFADTKGLAAISEESKDLAARARNRELQPPDWAGNTFSISNLGMFGIEEFTAIINPPDACILAVGGILDKAVVRDGQIVAGKVMKVTLSCDHRVVDGATGSAFLQTFKQLLEDPVRILV
jgi:pyruvate dehydrogenase E2 component (dihydrolipoamide acetyltransferase)